MTQLMRVLLLTVLCALFAGAAMAVAQEVDQAANDPPAANPNQPAAVPNQPAAAAPGAPAEGGEPESIMELILKGDDIGKGFMIVLALFSFAGATVAIERAFALRNSTVVPRSFCDQLRSVLAGEPSPEVLKPLCAQSSGPMPEILKAGLHRVGRSLVEIEKAMEDAAVREMSEIRGRIRPLNVIGSIAPLVGLLGTVVGMIIAFRTASASGLGKGEEMAKGIYMALMTTAGGLSIAIPTLLFSAFFNSKVEKQFREIDRQLMPAVPFLAKAGATVVPPPTEQAKAPAAESAPPEATTREEEPVPV